MLRPGPDLLHLTGQQRMHTLARSCTSLFVAGVLMGASCSSGATDLVANSFADHIGRLNGWVLLPEVVLRHCVIHVPSQAESLRNAHTRWLVENEDLISQAKNAVSDSVEFFAPMLRMTAQQTAEWQRDSSTLVIEEMKFWGKGRIEIYHLCTHYEDTLAEHTSEKVQGKVRTSLTELERLKGRMGK